LRRGLARALEGIRTLARAQRASQRTGRGKLQPIGVAGENVCLSGKTGSDRRRVKTTLLTQLRHGHPQTYFIRPALGVFYFSRLGRYAPDMMLCCERFELVEVIG
jgi:hypothetical protein